MFERFQQKNTHHNFSEAELIRLLRRKGIKSEFAWKEFLNRYSNLILKIIWQYERDLDKVMEKYLYICEKIVHDDFAILNKYNPDELENPPKFSTWFTIVVKNLCIEKHRKDNGRKRLPKAILKLSSIDQTVFKLYYWKGCSIEEINQYLINTYSDKVNIDTTQESLRNIQRIISPNGYTQQSKKRIQVPYNDSRKYPSLHASMVEEREFLEWIHSLLENFSAREKLIFKLRFFEDLSVPEISNVVGDSSQRKIYSILQKILKEIRQHVLQSKIS